MLEEQVVSFKVAKLAWEKGFRDTTGKWRGKSYYNYKGELNGDVIDQLRPANRNNPKFDSVAAPTQSLLQKWLRDKHDIHIQVLIYSWKDRTYYYKIHSKRAYVTNSSKFILEEDVVIGKYEEVLERALRHALTLIEQ